MSRITAVYRVRSSAAAIEERARTIAVEQSVELPVSAVRDARVRDEVVGKVEGIEALVGGDFRVRIGLAVSTTGPEPGQLLNMLFGNTSLHEDVGLEDAEFPDSVLKHFSGPHHGVMGLRQRCGAANRALTCSAIKPQGLPAEALARIAGDFARGGLDYVKDDHGLADQAYSPFDKRVPACARAVREANKGTGGRTRYVPSLSGHLDQLRAQVALAKSEGVTEILIAPMVVGLPAFHALVGENPDVAFLVHPAMAGAARIAPPFLLGRLFRLMGADATIFPNHGGRFGYSPALCRGLAGAALAPWGPVKPCLPTPGGGMSLERVGEMLDFYGRDVMLLIGGALLSQPDLVGATKAFTDRVAKG
jgi:ribulose-bisphosphate carboxylase large chain